MLMLLAGRPDINHCITRRAVPESPGGKISTEHSDAKIASDSARCACRPRTEGGSSDICGAAGTNAAAFLKNLCTT